MGKQDGEVSATEAAALLGVQRQQTVYNYRQRGLLTARAERRGMRTLYWFSRAEVTDLAERLAQGASNG